MSESIYLGFSVVFPLLFYMIIGIAAKRSGWMNEKTYVEMNRVVFRVFLTVLLFLNAYSVDADSAFGGENIKVLILSLTALAVVFTGALIVSRFLIPDKARRAVLIQGIYRSNLALFGLPVSMAIYGEGKQETVAVLIAVVVPVFNIIAAVLLNQAKGGRISIGGILKKTLSNPLVLASVLGLVFSIVKMPIAQFIMTPLEGLSKAATPLAFMVLGGSLNAESIRKNMKAIVTMCFIRLVLVPGIVLSCAVLSGISGAALVAVLVAFASPIAVSSYTMAKELEVSPDLAGELVAATTLMSILTMFMWIALLNFMKFI